MKNLVEVKKKAVSERDIVGSESEIGSEEKMEGEEERKRSNNTRSSEVSLL